MVDSKMTSDLNENQEEAFIRCVKEDRFCLV